jgi:hypothetical protein
MCPFIIYLNMIYQISGVEAKQPPHVNKQTYRPFNFPVAADSQNGESSAFSKGGGADCPAHRPVAKSAAPFERAAAAGIATHLPTASLPPLVHRPSPIAHRPSPVSLRSRLLCGGALQTVCRHGGDGSPLAHFIS